MLKQITTLLFILALLTSCNNNKTYKYVEFVKEESLLGGTETKEKASQLISAESDSAAYLEAYKNYSISLKVNKDMKQSMGKTYSTPVEFKLYDDKNKDITNSILFPDKEKREKEVTDQIFAMKNSIQESVDKNKNEEVKNFEKTEKVDLAKLNELKKYFRKKKDEFSKDNKVWYEPKSAPKFTNRNGLYCYFKTENGIPNNLRFRLQYYSDDWLFIKKVQFAIDGKAYEFIPINTETDSGNGGHIWEWYDQELDKSDKELIYALANAKNAKMKLIGRQYFDIKTITKEQKNSIKQTLQFYNAMGGKY